MRRRAFVSRLAAGVAVLVPAVLRGSGPKPRQASDVGGTGRSMTLKEADQILQEDVERRWELEHQREDPPPLPLDLGELAVLQRERNRQIAALVDSLIHG